MNSFKQKLPQICLIATIAMICIPHGVMCAWLISHKMVDLCPSYLVIALAEILLVRFCTRTARQFHALYLPIFVLGVVLAAYTTIAGELPGYPIAYVLETSTWEEVRGFFGMPQEQRILIFLGMTCATYLSLSIGLTSVRFSSKSKKSSSRMMIGVCASALIFAARDPRGFVDGLAASPGIGTAMFVAGPLSSTHTQIYGAIERKRPYGASHNGGVEVHVLIIGESSRRNSWSAYGYPRQTTPYLDAHKGEIILFSDTVADGNATVFAVPMMLTGISPAEFTFSASHGTLVDLARESGYFSSWLANQDRSISAMVGMEADRSFYSVSVSKPRYVTFPPDGILLPAFARELSNLNVPRLIVLHTYGSHFPYEHRFPADRAHFSARLDAAHTARSALAYDRETVDLYDDSILYMDWFLGQVIEQVRALKVPATVTYISDHGEDLQALDGRTGHGLTTFSPGAFSIPAFVWANEGYRAAHPQALRALSANASKRIRSHDFFYLIADLMGIQWVGASPQRSAASTQFIPDMKDGYIAGGQLVQYRTGDSAPR